MVGYARAERHALSDLLAQVGPDAPTLCDGWTTYDLAAHIVTRDRVASAGPGLIVPALHGRTERAERAMRDAHPYPRLVEMVREGPSRWHPTRFAAVDEGINLVEFAIHHEDVRRAVGMDTPRLLPTGEADALWRRVKMTGRVGLRRLSVGAWAERSDLPDVPAPDDAAPGDPVPEDTTTAGKVAESAAGNVAGDGTPPTPDGRVLRLRRGSPVVTLYGAPLELLLFTFGRRESAAVELRGDGDAIAAVTAARIGP